MVCSKRNLEELRELKQSCIYTYNIHTTLDGTAHTIPLVLLRPSNIVCVHLQKHFFILIPETAPRFALSHPIL
jgi:hypothetical protein